MGQGSRDISGGLDRCIDALYMSLANPGLLASSMSSLRSLFDAGAVCMFTVTKGGRVLSFESQGVSEEDQQRWVQHYADLDPMRPAALASKPGQWMVDDDLLHPTRTTSPEYVHDFARHAGIRWFSGGKVADVGPSFSFCTLQRPHHAEPFDCETLGLLDALLPHFQRVARLKFEARQGARLTLASTSATNAFDPFGALDALAVGVCIVDSDGKIKFTNRAGESLLLRKGFVRSRGSRAGKLELESAAAQDRLRRALHEACRKPRRAGAFSIQVAHTDLRLQIRVLPTSAGAATATAGTTDAMVFFSVGPPQLRSGDLEQLYDLTAAEAALVSLLAQGLSPQACAEARGVSVSTVRAQLSSALAKTGASTQSQLLSTVLALPSLLS